jgi:hypothetical protein
VHFSDVLVGAPGDGWSTMAEMGAENGRTHHAIALVGDHLYVLGGCVSHSI